MQRSNYLDGYASVTIEAVPEKSKPIVKPLPIAFPMSAISAGADVA